MRTIFFTGYGVTLIIREEIIGLIVLCAIVVSLLNFLTVITILDHNRKNR